MSIPSNAAEARHYRLLVIEIEDVVPRRAENMPNLFVTRTLDSAETRFAYLKLESKNQWYSGHLVRLRNDLTNDTAYSDLRVAGRALRSLVDDLSLQGYTVNRDTRVWNVYVVELDPSDVQNPGLGYVYVGETCKDPEVRLQEHLTRRRNRRGRLFSPVVARYGLRLRVDLAPKNRYFSAEAAKTAEVEWAEHLRTLRYVVEGGH